MNIQLPVDGASSNPDLEEKIAHIFAEYFDLWKSKQLKYGPSNISSMGKPGLYVRMNDKMMRLKRFIFEGVQDDKEGSQEDAWFDLLGYAAMGVMLYRGLWPDAPVGRLTGQMVSNIIQEFLKQEEKLW